MNTIFGNSQPPIGGPQQTGNPFISFVSNFMKQFPGMSPQQVGQQLLNSGQLSQEDFKNFSVIANRLTGRRQ